MPTSLRSLAELARRPNPWSLGDEVLYGLCRKYPDHELVEAVLAKLLLIGRVYAVAIERRRTGLQFENDAFYLERAAPKIIASELDLWIATARTLRPGRPEALETLVQIHGKTTELFRGISGLQQRSLASKYLHFHVPRLFYIYDSRALEGLRRVPSVVGGRSRLGIVGDAEYARFAEKCVRLSEHCRNELGIPLTPRELDNLLLALAREPEGAFR